MVKLFFKKNTIYFVYDNLLFVNIVFYHSFVYLNKLKRRIAIILLNFKYKKKEITMIS